MAQKRTDMPLRDASKRICDFDEVPLGFDRGMAKLEASRCLQCENPQCVTACPVGIDIPLFIRQIIDGKIESAYQTIHRSNILPSVCGRVCPQESQCEGACVLNIKSESVAIGALERYVGDYAIEHDLSCCEPIEDKPEKIAIVGSGPAGIACSVSLRRMGYIVDVYEALHEFGGVLKYGIPAFRLPKTIVDKEIDNAKELGVHFHKNVIIGKSITIPQLFKEYDYQSVFVGSGAGLPRDLHLPGENLPGILYANEFLTRVNLMRANTFPNAPTPVRVGDTVAVIGGGNVAMDAARAAKRLGAKHVMILYRRDMEALPARREEIKHAIQEDIIFNLKRNPVAFFGKNHKVNQVRCEIMRLGERDDSGRRRPIGTGDHEIFDIDSCIIAIGQSPNPIIKATSPDLRVDQYGRMQVSNHQTSISGVFAGGDAVSGAATVIRAMGEGKEAAIAIDRYTRSKKP